MTVKLIQRNYPDLYSEQTRQLDFQGHLRDLRLAFESDKKYEFLARVVDRMQEWFKEGSDHDGYICKMLSREGLQAAMEELVARPIALFLWLVHGERLLSSSLPFSSSCSSRPCQQILINHVSKS
jgi:hypothetical protein